MDQAIVTGCVLRLRPIVMTMMTTLLGLLPLVVLPALYRWFAEREAGKDYAPEWV